jgi:hypothetical protein
MDGEESIRRMGVRACVGDRGSSQSFLVWLAAGSGLDREFFSAVISEFLARDARGVGGRTYQAANHHL